jgi:carboxypeptidase D
VPALLEYNNILNMNESYLASIVARADKCGYTDYFNKYTTEFPPEGKIPSPPSPFKPGCDT